MLAFSGLGSVSPLFVALPLPLLVVIVLLELPGFVFLLRSIYYGKLNSFRVDWEQHPTPIVEREEPSGQPISPVGGLNPSDYLVDPGERYLGGFYSLQMGLGWGRNQTAGYGVYVTNLRLFGISGSRPKLDQKIGVIPHNLSDDDNRRVISELSRMRQFQAKLDEIRNIDLHIPSGLFHTGHLEVGLAGGDGLRIRVGRKQPGEQLKELLQLFAPSLLSVS